MSRRLEIEQRVKRVGRVAAAVALAGTLAGSVEPPRSAKLPSETESETSNCSPCQKMGNGLVKFCWDKAAHHHWQVSCDEDNTK